MSGESVWIRPSGTDGSDQWQTQIGPGVPEAWAHTGLTVAALGPGDARDIGADECERVVVPLRGSVRVSAVDAAGEQHDAVLAGRPSVFEGPSDVAFVPRGASLRISAPAGAQVAVCSAVASEGGATLPFRHVAVDEVPVEMRGAGMASREVRNFGTPAVLEADSIIVCEVLTPGGCWSSWPPHKHDEDRPGEESVLEEIYWFDFQADAPAGVDLDATEPHGYLRLRTDDHEIEELAEVHREDVVLVPRGWHGPAMAPPGYDMYYLNVMAGPGTERAWLIRDEPEHGWVRAAWPDQPLDARLPFGPRSLREES